MVIPLTISNRQPQLAAISAFAQNQLFLNVSALILEKHVTQLAKLAGAQDLFLHSAVVLM
jgi:hypothetical protein